MSDPPLVDHAALERLEGWGGRPLVLRMVDLFLELGPARLAEIEEGMSAGDLERVSGAAHSLKSSAGNLGTEQLRRAAEELEETARGGDREEVRRLARALARSYDETVRELERIRSHGGEES